MVPCSVPTVANANSCPLTGGPPAGRIRLASNPTSSQRGTMRLLTRRESMNQSGKISGNASRGSRSWRLRHIGPSRQNPRRYLWHSGRSLASTCRKVQSGSLHFPNFNLNMHSGILLGSYWCKKSHLSPFMQRFLSQCLQTTLWRPLDEAFSDDALPSARRLARLSASFASISASKSKDKSSIVAPAPAAAAVRRYPMGCSETCRSPHPAGPPLTGEWNFAQSPTKRATEA
mmetsp:Transcript_118202/g.334129  ORF Transcript_118202/g.334129 Transcript_118202/m.334129 type:complete len:231 (+) Transcript_118202:732-1424(+)